MLNETHDPRLQSWVASANAPDTDFTLQNLPLAVFRRAGSGEPLRGGAAIGDQILDLAAASECGAIDSACAAAAARPQLNEFMAAGPAAWSALRLALSRALRTGSSRRAALSDCLLPQAEAQFALPALIGDYTDFYTSIHHATAVGRLFRPEQPLLPNYKWMPIAYHGRCSSIVISGQPLVRPYGQIPPAAVAGGPAGGPATGTATAPASAVAAAPTFAPSQRLDYELEVGVFIGTGNELGAPIAIDAADSHVFGLCLLNDWSARDLQAWEYQPLGPFLGKNFATTISPWIVTLEALEPFRVPWTRPASDPQPLPYLDAATARTRGAIDLQLEVWLQTETMRRAGQTPCRLSHSNFRHAYWNIAQMVAHHSVNGCNLRPGDLLGTGTQSGPAPSEAGSLLELTAGGRRPLTLPDGETRRFLQDGDAVIMRGWCERAGAARVGFGELTGQVLGARHQPAVP
jgi:fumarylacetoacetase